VVIIEEGKFLLSKTQNTDFAQKKVANRGREGDLGGRGKKKSTPKKRKKKKRSLSAEALFWEGNHPFLRGGTKGGAREEKRVSRRKSYISRRKVCRIQSASRRGRGLQNVHRNND